MNAVRERILNSITLYKDYEEYRDLISFTICCEYFMNVEDEDNGINADFDEVVAVVEKEWLFNYMDMENPLEYLQNEYVSDDSIDWFNNALKNNKVVMVGFN